MQLTVITLKMESITNLKWIRIFDITETSKHKKGFTLYKVISMLYPETCPDAITKLTVWKRFNDFKKLYREIKVLHNKLSLISKFPVLPAGNFFKRYDEEIVKERKQLILNFLEFIGSQYQLFTSSIFVKFFETSHTPVDQLSGNITSIRADLNLPDDPEFLSMNSEDERTLSDTDSVSTSSSISPSIQTDMQDSSINSNALNKLRKLKSNTSITSQTSRNSDSLSIGTIESITLIDGQVYPTPPQTPSSGDTYVQYIIDASIHVNFAVELESDRKYDEAFVAYKTAIDILLRNVKDDKNYNRKQMVRHKTEKYLIRAEKIYNMYLAPEVKNLEMVQLHPSKEEVVHRRSVSDLYKYKVIRILYPGMLAIHSELQQIFYIKVIHKTTKCMDDHLILPENVPYMTKLHNYYNCDNALFLVLEYYSGTKLWDHIKRKRDEGITDYYFEDQIFDEIYNDEISDDESEKSFSELITNYAKQKVEETKPTKKIERDIEDSYEKIDVEDLSRPQNIMDESVPELSDLVNTSHNLIQSIGDALKNKRIIHRDKPVEEYLKKEVSLSNNNCDNSKSTHSSHRKLSIMSSTDYTDFIPKFFIPFKDVVKWSAQLLLALEKLHILGVICRDLQPHNLMIDEEGDLILTYMCNIKEHFDMFSYDFEFSLAPELYNFDPVTESVDWWNYGCILYELLVGMPLSVIHPEVITAFTSLKVPRYVSAEGRSLLKQLLIYDPSERLGSGVHGIENLKSHPFFNSVDWELLWAKYRY